MAEGDRPFLGLTHNPFIEPKQGFFEKGHRKTHVEQLRHLSEWSRRVLLVTGPDEVGKTSLYRELAATLEPSVKAARINGSLIAASREVLSAIAQGFGLAVPAGANSQLLKGLLLEHIEHQTSVDRTCLTLIDEAHLLDPRTIDEVMALVHESAMHLVLFGEVRMVPIVERAASSKGVGWHEIRLTGYGDADARDYLEWRFQQARYRGRIPFTDQQIREIVKLSEGLPGRIDQMANVLLINLESGEAIGEGRGFPAVHGILLVLLLIGFGLAYFLVFDEPTPQPEPVTASVSGHPETVSGNEADQANDLGAVAEGLVGLMETGTANQPSSDAEAPSNADVLAGVTDVLEQEPSASGKEPSARDKEPSAQDQQAVARDQALLPEPELTVPAAPMRRGGAWLLAQDPNDFTLQLVTLSTLERAIAFVEQQANPERFAIFQLQRDGRVLHVVLFGLFATREAAQRAADNLPPEVGNVQPWIRRLDVVQRAARTTSPQ